MVEEDIRVKREVVRKLGANLRLIDEGATKYAEILLFALNRYAETVPLRGLTQFSHKTPLAQIILRKRLRLPPAGMLPAQYWACTTLLV